MTTTAPRPTAPAPTPPRRTRRSVGRVAVVVAALVGALALAVVGQSATGVVAVLALLIVVAGAAVFRSNTQLIVPIVIYSMWFEGLRVGQISLGRVVAALAVALIAVRVVTSAWRPPAIEPRGWLPVYLVVAWAWAGGLYASVTGGAGGWFFQFLTLFLGVAYYLAMAVFLEGPEQLEVHLRRFVIIGAPTAILGLGIFLTLGNRVFGFNGGPNTYAAYIVNILPFVVVFARREVGWRRLAFLSLIPIYLGGLLATGSRGGMLAVAVVGMYILVTMPGPRLRRRVVMVAIGLLGMFVAYQVFAILNPTRFSLGAITSDRGAGRADIWNAAVGVVRENPVFGLGLGGFSSRAIEFIQNAANGQIDVLNSKEVVEQGGINPHNLYLALMLDMGLIGLTLYLGAIAATMKNFWDLRHTRWGDMGWAFNGALIGVLFGGLFGAAYNQKFLWVGIGAAAAAFRLRRLTPPRSARAAGRNGALHGAG